MMSETIQATKHKRDSIDPRVFLGLVMASIVAELFAHSELAITGLFIIALVWYIASGQTRLIGMFIFGYLVLAGISYASLFWLEYSDLSGSALNLSSNTLAARKAFAPLLFAILLATRPTGSFMASLHALYIPKSIGIGLAIALRFFPTITEEYRAIRNAQKFRNVGVGFWGTLLHLPRIFQGVFVPLIIRVTRIAEELSASITVRGMRFHSDIVSYHPVRFGAYDALALLGTLLLMALLVIADNARLGLL